MKKIKRLIKPTLILLCIAFIIIQFFHSPRNNSADESASVSKTFFVPDSVNDILKTSCGDCHSNNTIYPWYTNIQPIGWWLNDHVTEGKEELNFSAFSSYSPRRQYRKFTEIKEQIEESEMPLWEYTLIHRKTMLSDEQQKLLINWSMSMKDTLEKHYPIDSLRKRK